MRSIVSDPAKIYKKLNCPDLNEKSEKTFLKAVTEVSLLPNVQYFFILEHPFIFDINKQEFILNDEI